MADWMTIRVELLGQPGEPLEPAPGRVLLASSDHAFAELADGIDVAFARWDLTPAHEFELDDLRLVLGGDPDDPDARDSDEVTLGQANLGPGSRFRYTFDLGERWLHECVVDEVGLDPLREYGEEPEVPAPVFGWGAIPDQYGRDTDEDDGVEVAADDEPDAVLAVMEAALATVERPLPAAELAAATARLRAHAGLAVEPYDRLFAAAGLQNEVLPPDDEHLWLALAAGVAAPQSPSGGPPLEAADWAGVVIGLVRGDVGQSAEPEVLLHLLATCPEVESGPLTREDHDLLAAALATVVDQWQALGAVDGDRRLTALGRWGLPAALRVAWARPR